MKRIKFALAGALLALLLIAGGTTAYAQVTNQVRLLGPLACMLANDYDCVPASIVGYANGALDTFLGAIPYANLQDVSNLDSAGSSDIVDGDELVFADRDDSNTRKRISIGELEAHLESDNTAVGLNEGQVDARVRLATGQTTITGTFARNRCALATFSQPGCISAVGQGKVEELPVTNDANNDGKFWSFDSTGAYAFVDLPAGNAGTLTAVTAGNGLMGGGTSGAIRLDVTNPFTDADEAKLDGIEDNANDFSLPRDLSAFSNDLTGNGYVIQVNSVSEAYGSGPPVNAPTAATYNYITARMTGIAVENNWWYVRIPSADISNVGLYEVRSGDADDYTEDISLRIRLDGTNLPSGVRVDRRGSVGLYTYYGIFIPRKPAAESIILVRYDRLTINNVDIPYDLLLDAPPLQQVWPYPQSITALPERPWRRGITYWNDSTGTLAYAGVADYQLHTASGIGLELRLPNDDPKVQEIVFYAPTYTGSNPPASVVAGKATVLIKSGGTTANIFDRVTVNGVDYTVNNGAVISSGGLQFLINGLEYSDAVTLPNHPAGTVSFGARRRNGNFLIDGGNAPVGLIIWSGTQWRGFTFAE